MRNGLMEILQNLLSLLFVQVGSTKRVSIEGLHTGSILPPKARNIFPAARQVDKPPHSDILNGAYCLYGDK